MNINGLLLIYVFISREHTKANPFTNGEQWFLKEKKLISIKTSGNLDNSMICLDSIDASLHTFRCYFNGRKMMRTLLLSILIGQQWQRRRQRQCRPLFVVLSFHRISYCNPNDVSVMMMVAAAATVADSNRQKKSSGMKPQSKNAI